MAETVLEIANVRKAYGGGLRPLRVNDLSIGAGERVALSGLDAGAAEVLVNLVTGASVPDEGDVLVLGRSTASISDGEEWLAWLDRFGIVSPRAVLLDAATLLQNLAMPITLDIEPVKPDVAAQVTEMARDAGIEARWLERPIAALDPAIQIRAHLVRAIALNPVSADPRTSDGAAGRGGRESLRRDRRERRGRAIPDHADHLAGRGLLHRRRDRRLVLEAATGHLKPARKRFFGL